jgi:heterodisulfide reductase subunit A
MAVAVIGGGISGIAAALDLAHLGATVYLIERAKDIGGKVSELAECKYGLSPWIAEVKNHPNIKLLLSSKVEKLSGSEGDFTLTVSGNELKVASIVLAPGYDVFEDIPKSYAINHPDVVTALEFESIMRATTTTGELVRPSNGRPVKRIGFIQCIGSRCTENKLCSVVCCAYTAKEAKMIKERFPGIEVYIFYIDIRVFGKDEELVGELINKHGVRYIRSRIPEINPEGERLKVKFENVAKGTVDELELDMVVLAVGLLPSKGMSMLTEITGVKMDTHGYIETELMSPEQTNVPGIFVCGTATAPKNICESMSQGSAAALKAFLLADRIERAANEKEVTKADGKLRIGVVICSCEGEIGDVVDIPTLVEKISDRHDVEYVNGEIATCEEALDAIERAIRDHHVNRLVFAGCSPRGYEHILRNRCAQAGLNPYLVEYANIREHCAWVHGKADATNVAENLIAMAVESMRHREDDIIKLYPVISTALVIGGGVSGMSAALDIANAGHEVYLVEKESELGGSLRIITELQTGEKASDILNILVERIKKNNRVKVYTNARVADVKGRPGDFKVRILGEDVDEELVCGAVVLATGAKELESEGYYGYGKDTKVLTQHDFEKILEGDIEANTVVMIQCVGRDEHENYCSKVCCVEAIKNAIRALKKKPDSNVFILYRDVMTYGVWELLYREARERGVIFIKYGKEAPPTFEGGIISVHDVLLNDDVLIRPDLVVLSTPMIAPEGNEKLSELFNIPLNENGFLSVSMEHPRLRLTAVNTANRGVFICGSALFPTMIDECITQAGAAASKASSMLAKDYMVVEPITAEVDEELCRGCGICEKTCEYGAITLEESNGLFKSSVNEAICTGCGACAVACPVRAIKCKQLTTEQLISMIDTVA